MINVSIKLNGYKHDLFFVFDPNLNACPPFSRNYWPNTQLWDYKWSMMGLQMVYDSEKCDD